MENEKKEEKKKRKRWGKEEAYGLRSAVHGVMNVELTNH